MPPIEELFHKKIVVADSARGTVTIEPWPKALSDETARIIPGGSAAAAVLSGIYDGALILATGPLTGTMTPGSSLLVASCPVGPAPENPGVAMHDGPPDTPANDTPESLPSSSGARTLVPFLLRHGPALKSAGADFAVITGKAAEPSILIIADGRSRIEPAGKLAGYDVPALRMAFRARMPESRYSLILCGPAARNRSPFASVGLEVGTGLDRGALASWMANSNLVAVVLAGGGPLPGAARRNPLLNSMGATSGVGGFLEVLDQTSGGSAKTTAGKLLGRPAACHICPRPCMAYLRPAIVEGGILCADHEGFAALSKACPDALPRALLTCARLGLNPVAASSILHGIRPELVGAALEGLLTSPLGSENSENVLSVPGSTGKLPQSDQIAPIRAEAPSTPVPLWPYDGAGKRLAAGLVLGICPILLQRLPDVALERWIDGLDDGEKGLSLMERLTSAIAIAIASRV